MLPSKFEVKVGISLSMHTYISPRTTESVHTFKIFFLLMDFKLDPEPHKVEVQPKLSCLTKRQNVIFNYIFLRLVRTAANIPFKSDIKKIMEQLKLHFTAQII